MFVLWLLERIKTLKSLIVDFKYREKIEDGQKYVLAYLGLNIRILNKGIVYKNVAMVALSVGMAWTIYHMVETKHSCYECRSKWTRTVVCQ